MKTSISGMSRLITIASRITVTIAAAVAVQLVLPLHAGAIVSSGGLTDPIGDVNAGEPDIASGSILVDDAGNIAFAIHFAGAISPDWLAQFDLDLDRNPATGRAAYYGPALGVDAVVQLPSVGGAAQVLLYTGVGLSGFEALPNTIPVSNLSDGYFASLPLAVLGTSMPTMDFGMVSYARIHPVGVTGVRDMTGKGTVALGVPDVTPTMLLFAVAGLALFAVHSRVRVRDCS